MRYALILSVSALAWIADAALASAATVITTQTTGLPGAEKAEKADTGTLSIEGDRVKMASGDGSLMIYRGDLQKVWMIHPADRTYREMSPESMAKMREMMDQARQRMQQQLQSMPEEQRKRIEAMMAQHGGGLQGPAQPESLTYEKDGDSRTVGQWSCTPYKVTDGMGGHQQFCIARLGDAGLDADDLKGMAGFSNFMRQGFGPDRARSVEAFDLTTMNKAIGFEGIPIQVTHYGADNSVEMQTTVTGIDHKSLSNDAFDLPAGYTKQDMMPHHMGPPAASGD
jgi:hypothetical protein